MLTIGFSTKHLSRLQISRMMVKKRAPQRDHLVSLNLRQWRTCNDLLTVQTEWAAHTWMSWRLAKQHNQMMKWHQGWPKCRGPSCANKWLSFFVVEVCRQDSERYPEAMLHEILCGIQCHVQKQQPRERSRVRFWGMFLMHKWRICVHMVLEVVRSKMNLSMRRKKIVYGSLEFWAIWMHRHYWIQWYECVVCTLHYAVGWSIETLVQTRLSCSNPRAHLHTYNFCTQKINWKTTQEDWKITPKQETRYANINDPDRWFIRLHKKYNSLCPTVNHPKDVYLASLQNHGKTVGMTANQWVITLEEILCPT